MRYRSSVSVAVAVLVLVGTVPAGGAQEGFTPGAPGLGDPYFPLDGNGGYDVENYGLRLNYDPETDVLAGVVTITATATQNLSAFNLDLEGLEVRSVIVGGAPATWSRDGNELTVTPVAGIAFGEEFMTVITYDGIPVLQPDGSGFIATDDGVVVIGQPHVAASWIPVNDHPLDKASFTFEITVPDGLEAVANGVLVRQRTRAGTTTWTWRADEPMAPYLAMMVVGELEIDAYRIGRIRAWDAFDPDLFAKPLPRTGDQFAYSQTADFAYKRLSRTISVPAEGAELSFWVDYEIEEGWDYMFVEAHTVGEDDWTTLPDLNGNTSQDTGFTCPGWQDFHPFLLHYQDGDCSPVGTSGEWWAATSSSDGYEQWAVDLAAYAGQDVEVSITYATDFSVQALGIVLDDIVVSTGEGTTSFEEDGDVLDGWIAPGPPEDSPGNANDWTTGGPDLLGPTLGDIAAGSLARQGEIIGFLDQYFGPYPFSSTGGIVDDSGAFGFALENQTRPIYSRFFFGDSVSGDAVVVHELAHQWVGDSLALGGWQHIWLNEGFATYTEWLWSEAEGLGTAREIANSIYSIPRGSAFWNVPIGDPGPDGLFDIAVYFRGALTLHALRMRIGDDAFFDLVRTWIDTNLGGNVTTDEFIALAEEMSGQELDEFFDAWLYTGTKPRRPSGVVASTPVSVVDMPDVVQSQIGRFDKKDLMGD